MKRILKILGLTIAVAAGALWASAGGHRGWTQTSVPVKTLDEVTGIEGITYQRRFIPGLDFLGAALLGGSILAGASLIFPNRTTNKN